MLDDDILRDVCFTVEVPVLPVSEVARVRTMAAGRLGAVAIPGILPPASLPVCVRPTCPFPRLLLELAGVRAGGERLVKALGANYVHPHKHSR